MIDSVTSALGGALHEVDLAVNGTFKSQTDLRERLENIQVLLNQISWIRIIKFGIQTMINTLPQIEKSTLNPKQIQEAQKRLKAIEDTLSSIQRRVRKMEELTKK